MVNRRRRFIAFNNGDDHRLFSGLPIHILRSPRLASSPPNSLLNLLYALLESESRLSAAAMGLDPGIGLLHVDTPSRDSARLRLDGSLSPQGGRVRS